MPYRPSVTNRRIRGGIPLGPIPFTFTCCAHVDRPCTNKISAEKKDAVAMARHARDLGWYFLGLNGWLCPYHARKMAEMDA